MCASLKRGRDGTLIHCGRNASQQRQFSAGQPWVLAFIYVFQWDNVSAMLQKKKLFKKSFKNKNKEITVLKWPPNSPDLSLSEHLLDVLDRLVQSMETPVHNFQDLKDLLLTY